MAAPEPVADLAPAVELKLSTFPATSPSTTTVLIFTASSARIRAQCSSNASWSRPGIPAITSATGSRCCSKKIGRSEGSTKRKRTIPTGCLDARRAGCQAAGVTIASPARSSLDRDTRLLSGLLEETIAGQGGEGLRQAVVRLREAAARMRAGEAGADDEAAALVEEILAGDRST